MNTKQQERLISEFVERFYSEFFTVEELNCIKQEFNFKPKAGYKMFIRGTGSTNEQGKSNRQVFLGLDGYNVGQHICYI